MSAAVIDRARKAVSGSDAADWVGRVGWMARSIVYAVLSLIVIQVAKGHGSGGEKADQKGALQAVAERPFGGVLMVVLAVGFLAFAAGRLVEILTNDDKGMKRWAKIASRTGSALSQLTFAFLSISMVRGSGQQGQGPTARALSWPFGTWIVGAIGLSVIAVGLGFIVQGVRRKFMDRLEDTEMSNKEEKVALVLGVTGLISRGATFVLAGWFVVNAALGYDPNKASGLDAALRSLAQKGWGPPVLVAVAAGLACFSAYCAFMGRYRDVAT